MEKKGFSALGLLITFAVVGVIGLVGYFIYEQSKISKTVTLDQKTELTQAPIVTEGTISNILETRAYSNTKYGFKINPPKGWEVDSGGESTLVQFKDPTPDTVALFTIDVESNQGFSLSQYAVGFLKNFGDAAGSDSNLQITNQGETKINNQNAYKVEYKFNGNNYPFHGLLTIFIKNGQVYAVNAVSLETVWKSRLDLFNASISTFQLN